MNSVNARYPAYPLITCDPYLNVWSMSDTLYGDAPRHWTGAQHSMTGILTVDGVAKTFMGRLRHNPMYNACGPDPIPQKSVTVTPLRTIYTFADDQVELTVCFMTPLLPDDLMLLSRPVSYISYSVRALDGKSHTCMVYIDVSALLAVNTPNESVRFGRTKGSVFCGCGEEKMLAASGDDRRINWGYLHLAAPDGELGVADDSEKVAAFHGHPFSQNFFQKEWRVADSYPVLYYKNEATVGSAPFSGFVCVGYNDVHSLNYFGRPIDAYYKKDGGTFTDALQDAIAGYSAITARAEAFDRALLDRAEAVSDTYARLLAVAYRQVIAAHKLAWDGKGGVFVSKECFSNGCAATVDVTYPSIPLFLVYNPDLVEFMMNPIFRLIDEGKWPFPFAPHDAGTYPLVTGQVYGLTAGELQFDTQMPVEECGNMLLCVAAAARAKNDTSYAQKHFHTLAQWADYLVKFGLNPENQLCTDDFAGHLAHNCNLSVKAIMGIAAWGMLLQMMGRDGTHYLATAKDYAAQWKQMAFSQDHYRLAFDRPDSWSIKYNLVWDRLFGLHIFDDDVLTTEVAYYRTKLNAYGLPLDNRSDYTKSDWQMWSTVLTNDTDYANAIDSAMLRMLTDTPDRVPFTDWYYTSTPVQRGFQNRTVQGGLFIRLLHF